MPAPTSPVFSWLLFNILAPTFCPVVNTACQLPLATTGAGGQAAWTCQIPAIHTLSNACKANACVHSDVAVLQGQCCASGFFSLKHQLFLYIAYMLVSMSHLKLIVLGDKDTVKIGESLSKVPLFPDTSGCHHECKGNGGLRSTLPAPYQFFSASAF